MRISIVIPAHNEAIFLQDCLDSFAGQTYLPNEVIVVDDNSSDDTFKIAKEYAKKYDWIEVVLICYSLFLFDSLDLLVYI